MQTEQLLEQLKDILNNTPGIHWDCDNYPACLSRACTKEVCVNQNGMIEKILSLLSQQVGVSQSDEEAARQFFWNSNPEKVLADCSREKEVIAYIAGCRNKADQLNYSEIEVDILKASLEKVTKAFYDLQAKYKASQQVAGEEWISVEEHGVPVVSGKSEKLLVVNIEYGKPVRNLAYYFPDKFKTVEFEDWNDYNSENYPHMEEDTEKGIVWLKAGFYKEIEDSEGNEYWSTPLNVTHYCNLLPLPSPPKTI